MADKSLARQIEEQIAQQAGIDVVAEESDGTIVLSGIVESAELRDTALDIATELAHDRRIDDNLDIQETLPKDVSELYTEGVYVDELPENRADVAAMGGDLDPDFTDQPLLSDPVNAVGPSSSEVDDPVQEGDEVYFPPTDPVVGTNDDGEPMVIGGFEATSDDEVAVDRSSDGRLGDEAIAAAVRRELREDAATSDLRIRVHVEQGVVYLRGLVPSLDDAEDAEDVASRVPGVDEVVEELEVEGM